MHDSERLKDLMSLIGTPFNESKTLDEVEYDELYQLAKKNKIGLLFLESLERKNMIGRYGNELNNQRRIFATQKTTAARAANILNKAKCTYAIVKSIYPFAATPNDVDLLILGETTQYNTAVGAMLSSNYEVVGKEAPLEICLHDSIHAKHFNDPSKKFESKDEYDVDIYKEIGAGHIIYMNKSKLIKYIAHTTIKNTSVNVLETPAELALAIFHSIYPERIYTLLLHYFILYSIYEMDSKAIDEFISICHIHKMGRAAALVLMVTRAIQNSCFGNAPKILSDLSRALVGETREICVNKVPFLYSFKMLAGCFWEKKRDRIFIFSFIRQLTSMLNPRYMRFILNVYTDRKDRDTY
jgi:hypothetical protein